MDRRRLLATSQRTGGRAVSKASLPSSPISTGSSWHPKAHGQRGGHGPSAGEGSGLLAFPEAFLCPVPPTQGLRSLSGPSMFSSGPEAAEGAPSHCPLALNPSGMACVSLGLGGGGGDSILGFVHAAEGGLLSLSVSMSAWLRSSKAGDEFPGAHPSAFRSRAFGERSQASGRLHGVPLCMSGDHTSGCMCAHLSVFVRKRGHTDPSVPEWVPSDAPWACAGKGRA